MAKHDKHRQQTIPGKAQQAETLAAMKMISDNSLSPEQPAAMTPGRIGFEAYGNHPGPQGPWKTFDGRPIPTWENLAAGKNNDGSPNTGGPLTCERWEVAAGAVLAQQSDQREAEITELRTSLREFEELSATRAAEVLELKSQLEQARAEHSALMKGLEDARDRAQTESKALHSDLMAIEQTASGRGLRNTPQTELGKSALDAVDEVLDAMDMLKQQRQDGDALPEKGWASESARQLVAAIEPQPGLRASDVRALLLGDLLAQLLPHTGETGQNETASDVLRRALEERRKLTDLTAEVERIHKELEARIASQSEKMVKVQSAMVARRAPDAVAGAVLSQLGRLLGSGPGLEERMVEDVKKILKELDSCRAFFSESPLVAVAVRDDSAKVHERFSLLVLSWDGKAVSTRAVEEVRPWGDISPYLEQTVRKALIPGAYR